MTERSRGWAASTSSELFKDPTPDAVDSLPDHHLQGLCMPVHRRMWVHLGEVSRAWLWTRWPMPAGHCFLQLLMHLLLTDGLM